MSGVNLEAKKWRARLHARLPVARYRAPEQVGENFAVAVPLEHESPLSANQIFKRMECPRFRSMRHLEQELDLLADGGMVQISEIGHMTLYRWAE